MRRLWYLVAIGGMLSAGLSTCTTDGHDGTQGDTAQPTQPSVVIAAADQVAVYDGGLAPDWEYFGWSATIPESGPMEVDFGDYGGAILANTGLTGSYAWLSFEVGLPAGVDGDFLQVRLASDDLSYPDLAVTLSPADRPGFETATIAVRDLLAGKGQFDRIVFSSNEELPTGTTATIDRVFLARGDPNAGLVIEHVPTAASVECTAQPTAISPEIYGIAFRSIDDQTTTDQWTVGATSRRWGGNTTSRYNWQSGHYWNTALDYYWRNVAILKGDVPAHDVFLRDNWAHDTSSAVTVPMLGWVAKDATSYSFPVSVVGPQESTDPEIPDAGNGLDPDGQPIDPLPPSQTSVASTPESIEAWVRSMSQLADDAGEAAPFMYFLDNEPELWNDTHRDVHPDPLTYDELLERTIQYASAIRSADPNALIAGPSPWGWPAYFYSAADAEAGFSVKPDRLEHDDQPLLEWYLDQLNAHEQETGERLLDVLDVHFYPQADGVYAGGTGAVDPETNALRIRSTRALWDPTYTDESWIDDEVALIPRMKQWVADHYPGLKLSIGEYSFGAENHMSGGLAQAEALGRFGQQGLFAAYYWTHPPEASPVYWAFRAYRNYDGAGGHFLDWSLPTSIDDPDTGLSVFASTDSSQDRMVLVVLNTSPDHALDTTLRLDGCGSSTSVTAYSYDGDPSGFSTTPATATDGTITLSLAPYSINVISTSG